MSAKPKLRELALEMDQLSWSDVKSLAIQLDIGYATLRRIEDANQDISDPKNSTMEIWLETDSTASWKKIVRALNAIQKNELAKNIEKKYVKATSTPEPLATSIPASPEAIAQLKVDLTPGKPLTYHWEGHGFEIHIPADAISDDSGPVTLSIQANLNGDYQLPDDDHVFVSGVYWLALHPPVKFAEKVTVTIQHCGSNDADSTLTFATAKCTQKTLPYTFKPLSGGSFSESGYGSIQIDSFSGFGIFGKPKFYAFCTYYLPKQINVFEVHITVTRNIKLLLNEVRSEYQRAEKGPDVTARINDENISLDVPKVSWERDGWKLSLLVSPTMARKKVNDYKTGRNIPYFLIHLKLSDQAAPQTLEQKIDLKGVKDANFITILREPTPQDTETTNRHPERGSTATTTMGRDTPQYRAVLDNLDRLVGNIRGLPGAENHLQRQFREREWIAITSQANADELTTLALTKIEMNAENYNVFIDMLNSVTGLQEIVARIRRRD